MEGRLKIRFCWKQGPTPESGRLAAHGTGWLQSGCHHEPIAKRYVWTAGELVPVPPRYTIRLRCGRHREDRPVPTLRIACMVVREYVGAHGLGCTSWQGGEVNDIATGKAVAYITYEGSAWVPGSWPLEKIWNLDQ